MPAEQRRDDQADEAAAPAGVIHYIPDAYPRQRRAGIALEQRVATLSLSARSVSAAAGAG